MLIKNNSLFALQGLDTILELIFLGTRMVWGCLEKRLKRD